MFFRFGAAVALIVAISLLGIALEKRSLSLKRAISLQTYRAAQLDERRVQLRLRCEQLGAPSRLLETLPSDNSQAAREPRSPR
ncbi:MAG: hypothetical protein JNG89_03370 [Planctomycetaceae bacterium]|nr:hypothetical protein [Planctomycetaceae bacterium]